MKDKQIEKLRELVDLQGMFISYFKKYSGESERIARFSESITVKQSELAALDSQIEEREAVTDEEIMAYFNNHAVVYQNDDYALHHTPFLTRSGVLAMFDHFQSRLSEPSMPERE